MAQFYSFKVSQIKRETHDSVSISFDIDGKYSDEFSYVPGPFARWLTFAAKTAI